MCQSVKQEAMKFIKETEQLIRDSNTSHFPFGESFLMAKGIQLMDSDLLRSTWPYESEMMVSEKLLSGSDYALQLAALSGGGEGDEGFELKALSLGSVQERSMANSTLLKDQGHSADVT